MKTSIRGASPVLSIAVALIVAVGMLTAGQVASGAGPAPVGLGTTAAFAVLAGTPAVTNTGPTTVTGDLGIHPGAAVTGFPPGIVNGTIHAADAVALQAKTDLVTAYNDAAGRTPATVVAGGALGGKTLVGGVYNAGGVTLGLTGTLTLDGQNDPNSVWIFQATSDLITASSSSVTFINGAQPCNVFWQVTSSTTLGSGSTFAGTILALTSITMNSGVSLNGRALARNGDVTMINDTIARTTCAAAPTPAPTATPASTATVAPTAAPTVAPTAAPTVAPTAAPTVAPTAAPTAAPTVAPTPAATAAPAASPAAGIANLPSTATIEDGRLSVLLPLLVIAFAVLYMVARARRRRRQPIA